MFPRDGCWFGVQGSIGRYLVFGVQSIQWFRAQTHPAEQSPSDFGSQFCEVVREAGKATKNARETCQLMAEDQL